MDLVKLVIESCDVPALRLLIYIIFNENGVLDLAIFGILLSIDDLDLQFIFLAGVNVKVIQLDGLPSFRIY